MKDITNELLLALNLKAETQNTKYVLQIEYVYYETRKEIYPKRKVLKFVNRKLVNKYRILDTNDMINYLNNELLLYN